MVGGHREFIKGLSGILEPIYAIQREERREKNGERKIEEIIKECLKI
jgi:hypothetical protein